MVTRNIALRLDKAVSGHGCQLGAEQKKRIVCPTSWFPTITRVPRL